MLKICVEYDIYVYNITTNYHLDPPIDNEKNQGTSNSTYPHRPVRRIRRIPGEVFFKN